MARPSIEFGPLFYTQVIVGLTPTLATTVSDVTAGRKNEVKRNISRRYGYDGW